MSLLSGTPQASPLPQGAPPYGSLAYAMRFGKTYELEISGRLIRVFHASDGFSNSYHPWVVDELGNLLTPALLTKQDTLHVIATGRQIPQGGSL